MLAATTRAWYLPTWVNCQIRVTSPTAHNRSEASVDGHTVAVDRDSDRLQADAVDPRTAVGGDQQPVAANLTTVLQREDVVVAVAPGRTHACPEDEVDPVTTQYLTKRFAERRGLTPEQALAGPDQDDIAAEPPDCPRHLDADRPAANDHQTAWDRLHARRFSARPDAV
jgi:hypothetical protein